MEDAPRREGRRLRWSLGSMLVVIAVIAIVISVVKFSSTAMERAARAILAEYGPITNANVDAKDYRVESVTQMTDELWHVRFVRVAGKGPAERVIGVPKKALDEARFDPWWSPPDLIPQSPPITPLNSNEFE